MCGEGNKLLSQNLEVKICLKFNFDLNSYQFQDLTKDNKQITNEVKSKTKYTFIFKNSLHFISKLNKKFRKK